MELKTDLSLGLPGCDSPDKKNLTLFGKELDCHVTHNVTSSSPSPPPSAASASGAFTGCLGAKRGFLYGVAVLEKKNDGSSTPATKTQVVGWPPIRSYRKNTLSSNSTKSNEDGDEKCFSSACLYVKVSMDGAPYLRKVDIQTCRNYVDLSSALEKMFGCFITGKYGSYRHPRRGEMGESQSADHHCNTEYVLTYEDKDGDWMLVGDIPWKMFSENCRKLRIMKGSEAIGLTPKSE